MKETLQVLKMSEKIKMKGEMKVDLGRELVECNARLGECKLKLAEHNRRLTEYHDDEEETTGEQETINVNLLKHFMDWFQSGNC